MKKIIKFVCNNNITIIIITIMISTFVVYAAAVPAAQIKYSNSKTSQTTAKGALDELYDAASTNPFISRSFSTKYVGMGFSKTSNVDYTGDAGSGTYGNNLATKDVIRIPGTSKLHVKLTYATEASYDYVYVFQGEYTGSVTKNMSAGQLKTYNGGGDTKTTVEFDVNGDTATFAFYSDGSKGYYGYYAVVYNESRISNLTS